MRVNGSGGSGQGAADGEPDEDLAAGAGTNWTRSRGVSAPNYAPVTEKLLVSSPDV
jgi:hypothetical protein